MERLTSNDNPIPELTDATYWLKVYWKLKDYEQLGATPAQIKEVDALYADRCREVNFLRSVLKSILMCGGRRYCTMCKRNYEDNAECREGFSNNRWCNEHAEFDDDWHEKLERWKP